MTDKKRKDDLTRQVARLYLWQQAFGGLLALALMILALLSLR